MGSHEPGRLSSVHRRERRGDEYKLQKEKLELDIGEKFTMKMVKHRGPEVWGNLHPWGHSKLHWTKSWAI